MGTRHILILLAILSLSGSMTAQASGPHPVVPDNQQIRTLLKETAGRHLVPPEALEAVTLSETGRLVHGTFRSWPWSLNVAGKGYFYASREQACSALIKFMRTRPLKNIDVGIAQTNLGWHGHRFVSSCDALDPARNLDAAARILRECYMTRNGSWLDAAACYHHPRGGTAATTYRRIVQKHLATLTLAHRQTPSQPLTDIPSKTAERSQ